MRDSGRGAAPPSPIRVGVVGHTGYAELEAALETLRRLAPGLHLDLYLERDLPGVAGDKRID